jgi:hypothetical protein
VDRLLSSPSIPLEVQAAMEGPADLSSEAVMVLSLVLPPYRSHLPVALIFVPSPLLFPIALANVKGLVLSQYQGYFLASHPS